MKNLNAQTRTRNDKGQFLPVDYSQEYERGTKVCKKCGIEKTLAEFAFLKREKILNAQCRVCVRQRNKDYFIKNPEKCAAAQSRYNKKNIFARMRRSMKSRQGKGQNPVSLQYLKDLWEKQGGKCYWSGMEMSQEQGTGSKNPKMGSPDRLDGKKGYVDGNIVLCCMWTNLARNNIPIEHWIDLMKELNLNGLWNKNEK